MKETHALAARRIFRGRRSTGIAGLVVGIIAGVAGAFILRGSVSFTGGLIYSFAFIAIVAPFTFILLGNLPPLRMFCESHRCGKYIPSDAVWICGYCDRTNNKTKLYPFVFCCEECKQAPPAVVCPYCKAAVLLELPERLDRVARIARQVVPSIDLESEGEKAHRQEKMKLERDIEIAALNKRLALLKASPEFKQEVSAHEKLEKEFSEFSAATMGVRMLEREQRLKIHEECRDNPDLDHREMRELTVDAWVESHGLEPKRLTEAEKKGTL